MPILIQDLKLSIRQLWRRRVFTLTAVLTLAIGMGVNAVAFTVINGVLFKGSAIRATDNMGRIATTPGGDENGYGVAGGISTLCRRHSRSFGSSCRGKIVHGVAP